MVEWLLQHFNLNFGVYGCLLSLNNQKIAKNVKNDVIMTSQICENDPLQKNKYFFQTCRQISFKIEWFYFPYPKLLMDNFSKRAIFIFCVFS